MKNFKLKTYNKGCTYKFNRNYVKRNHSNFIPFGKGSYISKWDDDYWHGNKKLNNYIKRFLLKNLGKNSDEVFKDFCNLGFKNTKEASLKWDEYVKQEHDYSYDLARYGKIYGFYVDENNSLCYNKWNKYENGNYVKFTYEQLKWNADAEIPQFGKVRETPNGDLIGIAKNVRYVNDFYVIYKGVVLKLPVYHVPCGEIDNWKAHKDGTLGFKHNQRYKETFQRILIPLKKGYRYISVDWYDYYPGKVKVINEDGTYGYVNKEVIGNLGYGKLDFHIIINQAEKEYEKVMFQKRISSE